MLASGTGGSSPDACLVMLPPEVVRVILLVLDDTCFAACMRANRLFRVHTWVDYIERRYGRMTQPLLVKTAPLEAIEFLYARGRFHSTVEDVAHAARNRRADLFSWLDVHQKYRACACPVRCGLAQGGDVEFARPFFENANHDALLFAMCRAAEKGQTDMVAWLAERVPPTPYGLASVAHAALCEWHVETLQWTLDHGAPDWNMCGGLLGAMEKVGSDIVARWVIDNGSSDTSP